MARVAITVVAVAVLTAVVVKTGGLAGLKFAAAYKGKGIGAKLLLGVTKGAPSKTLKWYSALALATGPAIIKASTKWDTDMSLKYWYKEVEFKAKASY